ncbi:unnamed protein product [Schistosoma curassoni]|uniref:Rab GTPase n=1 Tax=Schistosoma curassoni TaxID=6186 RepID=A0A183JXZ5_9TREM|nr:unnamed protein product [Schistosoma curassoni]
MDHSNKGDCITETPKRISRVRKASEISDSTTLYKNKPRTTSLPLNDLLTSSFLQAFRAHHVSIYPDLNQIIEMAVSDIQGKQETMDSMEKSFMSSSEKFNQTLENLYNETDSKLIQEEELMRQRISILTDELHKETEDDKSTIGTMKTQCQIILDEIEEYEQQIDESKENVKELQTMKKVESIKKEKADVTACHKIQEEREILMKKLNELRKYKEDNLDNNSKRSFELNDSKSLIFKVLLIGSLNVGKQALLNRLSSNSFDQPLDLDEKKNNITISSSYEIKIIIYQRKLDDRGPGKNRSRKYAKVYSLNLHDFIGHKTCRAFYEKSDGIILIFDIWSKDTLTELEKYYYTSKENQNQIIHKPIYMILGNKKDLIQTQPNVLHNKIPDKCITDFVNDLDGTFFEISAKSGENVQEAIDAFLRKLKLASEKTNQSKVKENKKMGCCSCCFL